MFSFETIQDFLLDNNQIVLIQDINLLKKFNLYHSLYELTIKNIAEEDIHEDLDKMPMVQTSFSQLNELTGMLGKYKHSMKGTNDRHKSKQK